MLPRRHTTSAMQEGVLRSAEILSKAHTDHAQKTPPGWKILGIALPVTLVATLVVKDRGEARAQTRVNFDRSAIVSADLAGVRASAQELIRSGASADEPAPGGSETESPKDLAAAAGLPTATRPPSPTDGGRPSWAVSTPARSPRPVQAEHSAPTKECRKCELAKMGFEEPTEDLVGFAFDLAVAPEEGPKRLPVGTRIPATLTQPVTTSVEGTPVTAEVPADVLAGDEVAVPAGARLEGLAFASEQDDRARILFTNLIVDGKAVGIQGLALSESNEVGLAAKVVRKGSKTKRGGSALLRALGSAATLGLAGRGGTTLAPATYSLGGELNRGIQGMTRDWVISDKALRVAAGARAVVYVRAEVVVP